MKGHEEGKSRCQDAMLDRSAQLGAQLSLGRVIGEKPQTNEPW
jgi:hypothetical protein